MEYEIKRLLEKPRAGSFAAFRPGRCIQEKPAVIPGHDVRPGCQRRNIGLIKEDLEFEANDISPKHLGC